eukprot:3568632-Rhodomonas_salina.1
MKHAAGLAPPRPCDGRAPQRGLARMTGQSKNAAAMRAIILMSRTAGGNVPTGTRSSFLNRPCGCDVMLLRQNESKPCGISFWPLSQSPGLGFSSGKNQGVSPASSFPGESSACAIGGSEPIAPSALSRSLLSTYDAALRGML